MVKFSDGSPEYHTVIGFLHSLLPSVSPDSHAALEETGDVDADSSRMSTKATLSCPEGNLYSNS